MNISITKRELEAIQALYNDVVTNFEGADTPYQESMEEPINQAHKFLRKCRTQFEVDYIRKEAKKHGRNVSKEWIVEQLQKLRKEIDHASES